MEDECSSGKNWRDSQIKLDMKLGPPLKRISVLRVSPILLGANARRNLHLWRKVEDVTTEMLSNKSNSA